MFQRLRNKLEVLRDNATVLRLRAAFDWARGRCPYCYSLGRVVAEPDAPPTERYYIACTLCAVYMPQNVAAWQERQRLYDEEDDRDREEWRRRQEEEASR